MSSDTRKPTDPSGQSPAPEASQQPNAEHTSHTSAKTVMKKTSHGKRVLRKSKTQPTQPSSDATEKKSPTHALDPEKSTQARVAFGNEPEDPSEQAVDAAWSDYEEDASDWVVTGEQDEVRHDAAPQTVDAGMHATAMELELPKAAEAPSVHVPEAEPAPPAARWQGLSGQDANKSWTLSAAQIERGEIHLGRGLDNDIILEDPSISRNHAELRHKHGAWQIVDMQSGNGTFVGGQKITQASFVPGETLGLGHATYRFELLGEGFEHVSADIAMPQAEVVSEAMHAPKQRAKQHSVAASIVHEDSHSAQSRVRTWIVAGLETSFWQRWRWPILGVLALSSGVMGMYGWHTLRTWDWVGPLHTTRFSYYRQGVDALNEQHWEQAQAAFQAIVDGDPNSLHGQRYLRLAIQGEHDAKQLVLAQQAVQAKQWSVAYATLVGMDEGLFHKEVRLVKAQITEKVEALIRQAFVALEQNQTDMAKQQLMQAESIIPNRPDVALLRSRIDATLTVSEEQKVAQSQAQQVQQRKRRPEPLIAPVAQALRDFNAGQPDTALIALDASAAPASQKLAAKIREFSKTYQMGLVEYRGKRAFNAIQALTQAQTQALHIGGPKGKLIAQIKVKLADMYYVIGVQAFAGGHLAEASEAWHQATKLVPDHALSERKLAELEAKAEDMMAQAQSLYRTEPEQARELLRNVLEALPAHHRLAIAAKRKLKALH